MSHTTKSLSDRDGSQTLQSAYNDVDASLGINGFLVGLVGRKIEQAISTTTISGDTSTFSFSENGKLLYSLKIIYTDGTQGTLLSAERIA